METNNEYFDQKELVGQNLFRQFAETQPTLKPYVFTPRGSAEDVKFQSGNTYYMAEIKVRLDCDIATAVKYKPYCEFMKWDAIRRKALKINREKNLDIKILYINFLKDGVCVYELKNITSTIFEWQLLPESNLDKTPIDKLVTKLHVPLQIEYRYKEPKIEVLKNHQFPYQYEQEPLAFLAPTGFTYTQINY